VIARALMAAAFFAAPALAQAGEMARHHRPHLAHSPSDKAYAAAMDRMMGNMTVKPSGDADADFVHMMLPHHQGAVDMAQVELKFGKDPALLQMARDIVSSQAKEIEQMRAWQASHPK
jgi:uncharacterized protein (DUF305 family)